MCISSKCVETEELFKVDFTKIINLQVKWIFVEEFFANFTLIFSSCQMLKSNWIGVNREIGKV